MPSPLGEPVVRTIFLLVCCVFATAASAAATTMQPLDLSELTYVADLVAEAVVVANSVERVEGQEFLRTATTLRLTRVFKGPAETGESLDVLAPGGRLGGEETTIQSAPVFAPEERVLVFLETRDGTWRVVGWSQGKITLIEEVATGRDVVVTVTPPRGLARFDERAVQIPLVPRYFSDFLALIEADLDAGYVPPYRIIAGLPPAKDAAFRDAARAEGKLDPRWEER